MLFLIGFGLYLYLSAENARTVTQQAKPARAVAEQVAGVGMRESFDAVPAEQGGKFVGLDIKRLDAAGPMAAQYDLRVDDRIVQIGPITARESDPDLFSALLQEAGSRLHKLTILRDGQRLELDNQGPATGKQPRQPGGNLNPLSIPSH